MNWKNKVCIINLLKKDKSIFDSKDLDSLNEMIKLLNKFDIKLEFQQYDASQKYQTTIKNGDLNSKIEKENIPAWKSHIKETKKNFNRKLLNDPNLIILSYDDGMSITRKKSSKNSLKLLTPLSKK